MIFYFLYIFYSKKDDRLQSFKLASLPVSWGRKGERIIYNSENSIWWIDFKVKTLYIVIDFMSLFLVRLTWWRLQFHILQRPLQSFSLRLDLVLNSWMKMIRYVNFQICKSQNTKSLSQYTGIFIEFCQIGSKFLCGLYGIWSSMKISLNTNIRYNILSV